MSTNTFEIKIGLSGFKKPLPFYMVRLQWNRLWLSKNAV